MEPVILGSKFTWKKSQRMMWQRIDRVLYNKEWGDKFTKLNEQHLNRSKSDHAPLVVSFNHVQSDRGLL